MASIRVGNSGQGDHIWIWGTGNCCFIGSHRFSCRHTCYRHFHQQAKTAMRRHDFCNDWILANPIGILATPKTLAMHSKQEVSSETNERHHTPSIGLTLRSDLLGNVQGTAHITYGNRQHCISNMTVQQYSPLPRYKPRSKCRIR